jgi:hypothetical protein
MSQLNHEDLPGSVREITHFIRGEAQRVMGLEIVSPGDPENLTKKAEFMRQCLIIEDTCREMRGRV